MQKSIEKLCRNYEIKDAWYIESRFTALCSLPAKYRSCRVARRCVKLTTIAGTSGSTRESNVKDTLNRALWSVSLVATSQWNSICVRSLTAGPTNDGGPITGVEPKETASMQLFYCWHWCRWAGVTGRGRPISSTRLNSWVYLNWHRPGYMVMVR